MLLSFLHKYNFNMTHLLALNKNKDSFHLELPKISTIFQQFPLFDK